MTTRTHRTRFAIDDPRAVAAAAVSEVIATIPSVRIFAAADRYPPRLAPCPDWWRTRIWLLHDGNAATEADIAEIEHVADELADTLARLAEGWEFVANLPAVHWAVRSDGWRHDLGTNASRELLRWRAFRTAAERDQFIAANDEFIADDGPEMSGPAWNLDDGHPAAMIAPASRTVSS